MAGFGGVDSAAAGVSGVSKPALSVTPGSEARESVISFMAGFDGRDSAPVEIGGVAKLALAARPPLGA